MDDIQPGSIPCWLTLRDQYLLVIMKYIDSKDGGWNLTDGATGKRIVIDLIKDGEVKNINISQSYDPPSL
jgi:hypothetical protein